MKFKPFDAETVLDAGCALLRLVVPPEDRKGVRDHLKTAAKMAAQVERAELGDTVEPGPVYRP